jgi:hypothetical protein
MPPPPPRNSFLILSHTEVWVTVGMTISEFAGFAVKNHSFDDVRFESDFTTPAVSTFLMAYVAKPLLKIVVVPQALVCRLGCHDREMPLAG